jgi:adenylyltransferase/sulfurtransferase
MRSITPLELNKRLASGEEIQIIDIREAHERDICCLESIHIPMEHVMHQLDLIRKDITVVIHCKAGDRASAVVYMLHTRHGYSNVLNLEGGIIAWAEQVDPQMATY